MTLAARLPVGRALLGLTDRRSGDLREPGARAALAAAVGTPPERVVVARQVHGDRVLRVSGPWPDPAAPPEADGLVTTEPGLAVAVLVADCVPVLLADPEAGDHGVVAAVHAGRRGLAGGVVEAALAALAAAGADPQRTTAVVGPAAGPCCYEVPAALRDEVAARVPGTAATTRWGTPSLDLRAGAAALLSAGGVHDVRLVGGCTVDDPAAFSYRREAAAAGRAAGVAVLAPPVGAP